MQAKVIQGPAARGGEANASSAHSKGNFIYLYRCGQDIATRKHTKARRKQIPLTKSNAEEKGQTRRKKRRGRQRVDRTAKVTKNEKRNVIYQTELAEPHSESVPMG